MSPLLINAAVSACNSKSLSSHFATMRESAKIKTNLLSVTKRKDPSKPGPGGCHQAIETTSLTRPHFRNPGIVQLLSKTGEPESPVIHS